MRGRFKAPVMLNPDFRDILSAFNAERVEYLLVGAYAVAAHGLPRATGDIDLWIRPSTTNAQCVWRALERFGAPLQGISAGDLEIPELVGPSRSRSQADRPDDFDRRQSGSSRRGENG